MSDDDVYINFASVDSSGSVSLPKKAATFSGGRWKERRNLKLKSQGRERKPGSGVNNIDVSAPSTKFHSPGRSESSKSLHRKRKSDNPSAQREKSSNTAGTFRLADIDPSNSFFKRTKFAESSGEHGGQSNSYVSSLFTSNNASTLKESKLDTTVHQPSNAPLKDDSTFEGLGLTEKLSTHLTKSMRYLAPTKVQRAVIPRLLDSQDDLFVKAQTGSGKTLAFTLPIINRIITQSKNITRESGLFAMILTPTRELATQIYSVLESVLRCHHQIVPGIVVGGEKKKSEKARIRKGVNILVGTPGRLSDHMENTSSLDVSQVRWLVLDEADRLVELGFQETITKITENLATHSKLIDSSNSWSGLPTRRVNVLCSATMPDDVTQFGSTILSNPQMISVEKDEEKQLNATAPDQLIQNVMVVPPKLRLVTLGAELKSIHLWKKDEISRTIVFFSCADSVDFHFEVFTRGGRILSKKQKKEETDSEKEAEIPENISTMATAPPINYSSIVFRLHGSLSQQMRTSTLQKFVSNEDDNRGKNLILFCTDVASRGLDLPNISHVIEYDPPFSIDDHLHRIGRSARVGNQGEATLFLLPGEEEGYMEGKLKVVHPKKSNLRVVNYETLLQKSFSEPKESNGQAKFHSKPDPKAKEGKWDIHATTWHLDVERWLLEDKNMLEKASNAFISHIRAYATHLSSERMYFNVKLLHLGHLAKAFGLRDTPKKLGSKSGQESTESLKKREDPRKKMLRMARQAEKASASEFNY